MSPVVHTTHAVVVSLVVSVRQTTGHSHTTYFGRHTIGHPLHYSRVVTPPVVHDTRVVTPLVIHTLHTSLLQSSTHHILRSPLHRSSTSLLLGSSRVTPSVIRDIRVSTPLSMHACHVSGHPRHLGRHTIGQHLYITRAVAIEVNTTTRSLHTTQTAANTCHHQISSKTQVSVK